MSLILSGGIGGRKYPSRTIYEANIEVSAQFWEVDEKKFKWTIDIWTWLDGGDQDDADDDGNEGGGHEESDGPASDLAWIKVNLEWSSST